jgi:hypothetical protein
MIVYRPVAPLALGRPGILPALAAMALAAMFGTDWQCWNEHQTESPYASPDSSEGNRP